MRTMPFGKHKGRPLDQIPLDYLCWLQDRTDLREPLRTYVTQEIGSRFVGPPLSVIPTELREIAAAIRTAGFRALSLRLHPDRNDGHGHEEMVRLNSANECLRKILGEV